jgi:predicted nucleic acid-binding protein
MIGRSFLDTNVLVYAYDPTDPRKQKIAEDLVKQAMVGHAVISTQVLAEFAATLLHRVTVGRTAEDLVLMLDILAPIRVVSADGDTVRRAVEARRAYGIHFYDGMIVAAAERAGCEKIWSEDFNPGQKYFGVAVANPFA